MRIRFSLLVIQKVLEEIAVVVWKIVLAILFPTQVKPFLLESLLKAVKVCTFVINQNTIEIKNDPPDLHRNPFISRMDEAEGPGSQSKRRDSLKFRGVIWVCFLNSLSKVIISTKPTS